MRTATISIGIMVIFILAVLIGMVVIALYKRRANRVLRGESSGAHTNIPAPTDTVNGLFKILTVILLVWICISMGRLTSIQQELENLKNSTQTNTFEISGEVDRLRDEITAMNSRVYSYSSSIGSVDSNDNTCMVKHMVRLKSFSDDTEVVFVSGDGKEEKMVRTGAGRYEVELKADLFKENYEGMGVTISENGTSYFEEIEDEAFYGEETAYWQMLIPSLQGEFGIGAEYKVDNIYVGTINLFSMFKSDYHIASARIIVEKNGTEIDSVDALSSFATPFGEIQIPVNKDYPISEKDNLKATLVLVTQEGYTLEELLMEKTENLYKTYGNSFTIKDKNGRQVLTR